MKTPHSTVYRYSGEAIAQANKIPIGTISEQSHKLGMERGEPLLVAMDAMLRYAEAHRVAYETPLAEDYVLGPEWLETVKGLRGLLNGNGAVANMINRSTDSKDNGAIEGLFWDALQIAGYSEEDL